jgi:hypothetical protein
VRGSVGGPRLVLGHVCVYACVHTHT